MCAKLGIRLVHSQPYRPQGRGKIERFFGSVRSQFLTEITVAGTPAGADGTGGGKNRAGKAVPGGQDTPSISIPAAATADAGGTGALAGSGTVITTLKELNTMFSSWIHLVYHRTQHTGTGQTPLARWEEGWVGRTPDRRELDVITEAFRWSETRKVSKTGTVTLHGNIYQVDPLLAGARVELIYDPFDLTDPIAVTAAGVIPAGMAVLQEVRRHVHPKAVNAIRDADAGAANTTTGIDYLRLLQDRHATSLTGARISFDKLTATGANPTTPATTTPAPTTTTTTTAAVAERSGAIPGDTPLPGLEHLGEPS